MGSLVREDWGAAAAHLQGEVKAQTVQRRQSGRADFSQSADLQHRGRSRAKKIQQLYDRSETGSVSFATGDFSVARVGRRRTAIRPPRFHRSHGQRSRRLSPAHPWRACAHSLAHRNRGLGDVHSSALWNIRLQRAAKQIYSGDPEARWPLDIFFVGFAAIRRPSWPNTRA